MKKVLIADGVHHLLIEGLSQRGYKVDYKPEITLEETYTIIQDYAGIVINTKTVMDKSMLDKGTNLEFIARLGSGMEIVDVPYASQKGIYAFNTPEGNRNAVAEQALGMLLSLFNNIVLASNEVKELEWNREPNRGEELDGKTVGLIGFGNTGQAFAKKLLGFDCKVLYFDIEQKESHLPNVEAVPLEQIYAESDVLSLHLPLTNETFHWLNKERLSYFRKPLYIINSSRGKVVKTDDLLEGLKEKKVLGAVLDVLENEKISTLNLEEKSILESLLMLRNVIVTPHIAGWTHQSKMKIAQTILDKLDACS